MTRAALTPGDDVPALAERCLRKLANRHGHRRVPYAGGLAWDLCPDPVAHKRDVADMSRALMAAGLAPYEAAQRYHFGQRGAS